MTRERLRRTLALASVELLGTHAISHTNIKRYVIPHLTDYRICKNEPISNKDIRVAMNMIVRVLSQKPVEFRFGRGDVWRAMLREVFLNHDLPVL